jgi:hypothetical protein
MEVIGADGVHIGTVDRVEENQIKLIRADSGMGHEEHHHYVPRGLVAEVEGDRSGSRLAVTSSPTFSSRNKAASRSESDPRPAGFLIAPRCCGAPSVRAV